MFFSCVLVKLNNDLCGSSLVDNKFQNYNDRDTRFWLDRSVMAWHAIESLIYYYYLNLLKI